VKKERDIKTVWRNF